MTTAVACNFSSGWSAAPRSPPLPVKLLTSQQAPCWLEDSDLLGLAVLRLLLPSSTGQLHCGPEYIDFRPSHIVILGSPIRALAPCGNAGKAENQHVSADTGIMTSENSSFTWRMQPCRCSQAGSGIPMAGGWWLGSPPDVYYVDLLPSLSPEFLPLTICL